MVMKMLKDFAYLSVFAGMRADWIQAAGGNTSVKISDTLMYIKSSGVRLAEVTENSGMSVVNYRIITELLQTGCSENDILQKALVSGARPSIETFLHSFTGTYTLHTHPVAANVLLSTKGGMDELQALFPQALLIGYHTPGLQLGIELYNAYKERSEPPEIIFLQNHGMIVSGDSAVYVLDKTQAVLDKISRSLGISEQADKMTSCIYEGIRHQHPDFQGIVYHSENKYICQALEKGRMWQYDFCPDCIVYGGETIPDITNSIELPNPLPSVVLAGGEVYILAPDIKKAVDIESVLSFSAKVSLFAGSREILPISGREQSFLTNWDAEKYRKQMK